MRIDFAFNVENRFLAACKSVRKHYLQGHKVLVFCSEESIILFDDMLWFFDDTSFIPHVLSTDLLAEKTPIILTIDDPNKSIHLKNSNKNKKNELWLLNLSEECPPGYSKFTRLLEIVSKNPMDRSAARRRLENYKLGNHKLYFHKL